MSGIVGRIYLERGEPVTVICQWAGKGPRNVCIERLDGSRVVRPFRGLRKGDAGDRSEGQDETTTGAAGL